MAQTKFVKLGNYITECDERNTDNRYDLSALRGVSINKEFIPSKANMEGVSLKPYKLVRPDEFCFVTITSRNGEKISIAQNTSNETYIVSSSYVVFRITDKAALLPDYLFLIFRKPEFDRYARFNSWGSAREAFTYESLQLTEIPLPPLSEQQKVVNAWKAFREIKEQNEAKAEPLMQLCQSYIQELKHKYPKQEIGPFIKECNERNYELKSKNVRGVSTEKEFRVPQSRVDFGKLDNYKVVYYNQFVFVPTTDTWRCLAICLNKEKEPIVVSPIYCAFSVDENVIIPEFLHLYCRRKEIDRYARFHSWGSARENFNYSDMQRMSIPIPPIDVQRAIVSIYKCANEAKQIAAEADRLSREVCPALLQHVIHS